MKRLISQNGVVIDSSKEFKVFDCKNCGAKFESNEYKITNFPTVKRVQYIDICLVCKKSCVIDEPPIDNYSFCNV